MMKSKLTPIIVCLLLNFSVQSSNDNFTRQQVIDDLAYLYQSLIDTHYNIYAYTSEDDFLQNYRRVKKSLTHDSYTRLEVISLFQRITSAVNNGHTEIDFPGTEYGAYAHAGGTLFPLELAFEQDKSLVRKNHSNNNDIKIGDELISINGVSIEDVLAKIYPQISAERPYFKHVKLELYSFPRYYWQVFGETDQFQVVIQSAGLQKTHTLQAVKVIEGYEMKRDEVLNAKMQLKFFELAAYINPGNFSGDENAYREFIDQSFAEINRKGVSNLIVDLRNNAGGDNAFSDYLVAYFADKPFKWHSSFQLKTSELLKLHTKKHSDLTKSYAQSILSHQNGEQYKYQFDPYQPHPEDKRFTGNVYVLINRQSHSQAAVTAAQIQDYQFGTIVGEETGDFPSLYASQFSYALPNTQIPVKVSKGKIIRVNGSTAASGVIPDISIKDHLLDENDEILKTLLERIQSP